MSSGGQTQHGALEPTPDSEPVPRSRVLNGDRLIYMFWWVGKSGTCEGNPCEHGQNIQTPHRKALPQPGIKPRTLLLWGNSVSHHRTIADAALQPESKSFTFQICITLFAIRGINYIVPHEVRGLVHPSLSISFLLAEPSSCLLHISCIQLAASFCECRPFSFFTLSLT